MKKIITLTAGLIIALGAGTVHAATLGPAADTYVYKDEPNDVHGTATGIVVINDGGSAFSKGKDRLGVLRFDLSSITETVADANFVARSDTIDSFEFQLWGINDANADENFDPNALTFNTFAHASNSNDGSIDTTNLTLLVDAVTDASDGSNDNLYVFSSTALVDFLNNDTNNIVSFVLFRTTGHGASSIFSSSEASSNQPALNIEVVPEPASLALLAACGLMMIRWR